jgi:hypothetical protein
VVLDWRQNCTQFGIEEEIMKTNVVYLALTVILAAFLAGCSNNENSVDSSGLGSLEALPKEQRLAYFNQKLKNITDEVTAREAIEMFQQYVKSRFADDASNPGIAAKQFALTEEQLTRMSSIECKLRQTNFQDEPAIDSKAVARSFSTALVDSGAENQTVFDQVLSAVRSELPALAVYPDNRMTPLESMVVSYTYYCGDDGSASVNSIVPGANRYDLADFVKRIF